MTVEVFYVDGCPNHRPAVERMKKVLQQERISVPLMEIEIHNESEAKKIGFPGSPTIRVNGLDVDPKSRAGTATGMACRYHTGGLPSEDMICAALREAKTMKAATASASSSRGGRTVLAGAAAVISVVAASSCCLPILPFALAAGLAGSSTFLTVLRPYLLGVSVLFIAFGFYQAHRNKRCNRRSSLVGSALLWTSALFVFLSIFFPQVLANAAANLLAR